MAVTRRQSGKLPQRNFRNISESDKETLLPDHIHDEAAESSDDSSSDGSVWHPPTGQRSKVKRTRLSARASRMKRIPDLSRLMTRMPMDIIYEIFGHLCPIDLLNLARSSKFFRGILMSRRASTIWKTSRRRLSPQLPAPPVDVAEPRWENLWYGGARCQECGVINVHRIDYGLRRRLCTTCLRENLIYSSHFATAFPNYDDAILNLIPYTHIGGWAHGHSTTSKFYWIPDIHDMAVKLGAFRKNIHMGKPGAKKTLKDFEQARAELVKSIPQDILAYKC